MRLMLLLGARPEFASAKAVCTSTASTARPNSAKTPRRVCYAAPVLPNDPVEDRAPFGQPLERADLVRAHEAAVAFDIRCEASADWNRV